MKLLSADDLPSFESVKKAIQGTTASLLLGNGFSLEYDQDRFSYDSIFDKAGDQLGTAAKSVFERLRTTNFEAVMHAYDQLAFLMGAYEYEIPKEIASDRTTIRDAFLEAFAEIHPDNVGALTKKQRKLARKFLAPFRRVFTTNYDLLLYWAVLGPGPVLFDDGFAREAGQLWFRHNFKRPKELWFLHGALHLFGKGDDSFKAERGRGALLDVIRLAIEDQEDYPIIVLEGESDRKLAQIRATRYLRAAYSRFRSQGGTLVTFGFGFTEQDAHLVTAIAGSRISKVFVGLRDPDKAGEVRKLLKRAADDLREKPIELSFYDSTSADVWGKRASEAGDAADDW